MTRDWPSAVASAEAPLSILHVAAPARFGGLESVLRELSKGQLRRGHTVRVVLVLSPDDRNHPLSDALASDGVMVIPLHIGNRDYCGERSAIRALSRQYRPDILHTHGYRSDVVDGPIAHSEGIRAISTCHGFIESSWRGRVHQWLQRRALRRFDAVVAVSREIQGKLLAAGVERERIHVVPNAFAAGENAASREEARRLLQLPSAPIIGWVGRLSAEKGPDIALEAFARLNDPSAHLVFIGTGRDAIQLRARAETLRVSSRVNWVGQIPNAGTLFRGFDIFLLSSRTEGTPMALLEAIAAGVPVVATRVGGVADVVDTLSAYLVQSGDIDGIAAALAAALDNPKASHVKAERARKYVEEHFGIEPWLSSYDVIYRDIADGSELPW